MGMMIPPDSDLGKELARWNQPYVFHPFPKMLYMARERPDGKVSVQETVDSLVGGHPGAAESFTASCQKTVQNEAELIAAREAGWRDSPKEAMERYEYKMQKIVEATAHRNFEDRNMSPEAKAEIAAVEAAASGEHLPEIPEVHKRRGRPPVKHAAA